MVGGQMAALALIVSVAALTSSASAGNIAAKLKLRGRPAHARTTSLNGTSADFVDANGNTKLHIACAQADEVVVDEILARGGADVCRQNSAGQSALSVAVSTYRKAKDADDDRDARLLRIISALVDAGSPYDERALERNYIFDLKTVDRLFWSEDEGRRIALIRAMAVEEDLFNAFMHADVPLIVAICKDNARWMNWTCNDEDTISPFQLTLSQVYINSDTNPNDGAVDKIFLDMARLFAAHEYSDVSRNLYTEWSDNASLPGSVSRIPPLHAAAVAGPRDLLQIILDRTPAQIDDLHMGTTALDFCAAHVLPDVFDISLTSSRHGKRQRIVKRLNKERVRDNMDLLIKTGADIWASRAPLAFFASSSVTLTELYLERSSNVKRLLSTRISFDDDNDLAKIVDADGDGATALWVAVRGANDDVAMALIDAGADINAHWRHRGDRYVLIDAIHDGLSVELVRKLVLHPDTQIDKADENGETPLSMALKRGLQRPEGAYYKDIVDLLLNHGASPNTPKGQPYADTLDTSSPAFEEMKRRLLKRPPITPSRSTARVDLFQGIRACNVTLVRRVCSQYPYWHAWTDDNGDTPFGTVFDNLKATDTRRAVGLDLWDALAYYLFDAHPYPELDLLHMAVRYGLPSQVDSIGSSKPAHVNRTDVNGMAALSWCSWDLYWNRSLPIAERLRAIRDTLVQRWQAAIDPVSFIAAVDVGITAAYLASHRHDPAAINVAVRQAVNTLIPQVVPAGSPGHTALHMALLDRSTCNEEIALFLIDQGADLTAIDDRGRSPLHLASRGGFPTVVERILTKAGPDLANRLVSARDHDGMTPVSFSIMDAGAGDASRKRCLELVTGPREGQAILRQIRNMTVHVSRPAGSSGLHRARSLVTGILQPPLALAGLCFLATHARKPNPVGEAHRRQHPLSAVGEVAIAAATAGATAAVATRVLARQLDGPAPIASSPHQDPSSGSRPHDIVSAALCLTFAVFAII
ncbi:PGG domain-containing protein [Plasmodiophora brassicae]